MGSLGEGISSSMRLGSSPRAERLPERLLGRLPRPTVYSALEIALLVLIAVQAARLLWILVTPVGPVGDWKAAGSLVLPDGDAAASPSSIPSSASPVRPRRRSSPH